MLENIFICLLLCTFLIAVTVVETRSNECGFGKFGTNCTLDCQCNQNGSTGNRSFYGICYCHEGYWGLKCQRNCRSGCPLKKCNPFRGSCICDRFKYGANCDIDCPCDPLVSSGCDSLGRCLCKVTPENVTRNGSLCPDNKFCRADGQCRCRDWKYGTTCDKESTCNRNNTILNTPLGGCFCELGYYGDNCEFECRTDCQKFFWNNTCKYNGNCWCLRNYYGTRCENKCNCGSNEYCHGIRGCLPKEPRKRYFKKRFVRLANNHFPIISQPVMAAIIEITDDKRT
ncbi:unnamed protein product [Gordionus sp. m RMFG-2023]